MDIDYVDCLMLHSVIFTKLPLIETYKEMNRMIELGKAKSLGLSNSNLEQLKEINEQYPINIYEGVYNLECKLNEDIGITYYCKDNNIVFCAYQPLRRNRTANRNYPLLIELSNKYNKTQNQILFALQGMEEAKGQDEKDILNKLSALFNKKVNDWIKIDFSNWSDAKEERFEIIKSAILNKRLIQFTYYNSNGEESKRIVEPLQIWFKDKSWYLISYCKLKQDYRIFKIARMKEINYIIRG